VHPEEDVDAGREGFASNGSNSMFDLARSGRDANERASSNNISADSMPLRTVEGTPQELAASKWPE
jgi:hypothetical protein